MILSPASDIFYQLYPQNPICRSFCAVSNELLPGSQSSLFTTMRSLGVILLLMTAIVVPISQSQSILGDLDGFKITELGSLRPGVINEDIDSLLKRFRKSLPSVIKLNNLGNGYVHNCYLTGLDNGIMRIGNATLEIPKSTSIFNFAFATNRLDIQCSWKTVIGFVAFMGTVGAHTNSVHVKAVVTLDILPGAPLELDDFKVTYLDQIKTDVSGTGLFDWLGEIILDKTASKYRETIIREIENNVSRLLKNELKRFKLPTL